MRTIILYADNIAIAASDDSMDEPEDIISQA